MVAYLILSNSGGFDDFPDMCRYYIGPWAYYLATFASVAILFVVSMVGLLCARARVCLRACLS